MHRACITILTVLLGTLALSPTAWALPAPPSAPRLAIPPKAVGILGDYREQVSHSDSDWQAVRNLIITWAASEYQRLDHRDANQLEQVRAVAVMALDVARARHHDAAVRAHADAASRIHALRGPAVVRKAARALDAYGQYVNRLEQYQSRLARRDIDAAYRAATAR